MSIRTAVIVGCAMGFWTLMPGSAAARTHNPASPPGMLLHQRLASALFRAEGVAWVSSGHCSRRRNRHCTSFEGLRAATFSGLLGLKRASRCHLVVSGGTEAGHARGRYSHGTGYKLDVLPNRCLDHFIPKHFRPLGTRGDGAGQYRGSGPVTFAREPSHWDITFGGRVPGRRPAKPGTGHGAAKPGVPRGGAGADHGGAPGRARDDAHPSTGIEDVGSGLGVADPAAVLDDNDNDNDDDSDD